MTYPSWPVGVNYRVLVDGYSPDQPNLPPEKTDMDAGNVRMRRKYTVQLTTETVQINLRTEAEFEAFRIWHRDTLQHGSSKFVMPVWVGGSYQNRTCYMIDGQYTAPTNGGMGRTLQFQRAVENM